MKSVIKIKIIIYYPMKTTDCFTEHNVGKRTAALVGHEIPQGRMLTYHGYCTRLHLCLRLISAVIEQLSRLVYV